MLKVRSLFLKVVSPRFHASLRSALDAKADVTARMSFAAEPRRPAFIFIKLPRVNPHFAVFCQTLLKAVMEEAGRNASVSLISGTALDLSVATQICF